MLSSDSMVIHIYGVVILKYLYLYLYLYYDVISQEEAWRFDSPGLGPFCVELHVLPEFSPGTAASSQRPTAQSNTRLYQLCRNSA